MVALAPLDLAAAGAVVGARLGATVSTAVEATLATAAVAAGLDPATLTAVAAPALAQGWQAVVLAAQHPSSTAASRRGSRGLGAGPGPIWRALGVTAG
jgi:hypothetical protein